MFFGRSAAQRVTHLVGRDADLLPIGHDPALALETRDGPVDRLLQLDHRDRVLLAARREQRSLVHDVLQVCAGEARRPRRERLEVDGRVQRDGPGVHAQDGLAATQVWPVDDHLPVEPTGSCQRGVQDVATVRRGHDDHALAGVEPVHLDQQLVQRLLALVVRAEGAAQRAGARLADRVQLVEEDQARGLLLRLLEQLANARGAKADEHLDELGAAHEEEGDVRLAGDRPRQERLAAPGGPEEQHALRDTPAETLILLRLFQEVDDLVELLDRLVDAGHVLERGLHLLAVVDLHAVLAEVQRTARAAARHAPEEEEVQQRERNGVDQDVDQDAREHARRGPRDLDAGVGELGHEVLRLEVGGERGAELAAVLRLPRNAGAGDVGLRDLPVVDLLDERRVAHRRRVRVEQEALDQEHQEDRADDVRDREPPGALGGLTAAAPAVVPTADVPAGEPAFASAVVVVRHIVVTHSVRTIPVEADASPRGTQRPAVTSAYIFPPSNRCGAQDVPVAPRAPSARTATMAASNVRER